MKKYVRFAWDQYYPCGGLGDMRGSYDDLEEACFKDDYYDYTIVVDRDTWETVWSWDNRD